MEFKASNNVVRLPAELGLEAEFEVSSSLGTSEWKDAGRQYDAVTCMFALHYFFASERSLKQMLHNVSINLKPGGPPDLVQVVWPTALVEMIHCASRSSCMSAVHMQPVCALDYGCRQHHQQIVIALESNRLLSAANALKSSGS